MQTNAAVQQPPSSARKRREWDLKRKHALIGAEVELLTAEVCVEGQGHGNLVLCAEADQLDTSILCRSSSADERAAFRPLLQRVSSPRQSWTSLQKPTLIVFGASSGDKALVSFALYAHTRLAKNAVQLLNNLLWQPAGCRELSRQEA